MKLLTVLAISLFSMSAVAGVTCKNFALKSNVEACYPVHSQTFTSNSGISHTLTRYVLEYECDLEVRHTTTARDSFAANGNYSNKSILSRAERISKKEFKNTLSYCESVAEHIESKSEYPGVWDQANYFGKALGL